MEWLETNGTGAFAMGTSSGLATRRYHGLLVASLRPPTERIVALARLDEEIGGVGLATVQYPGALVEPGRPVRFEREPMPTWIYDLGDGRTLTKELLLVPGQQAVAIRYRASAPVTLRLSPFLAMRDYHSLGRARSVDTGVEIGDGFVAFRPEGTLPALRLWYDGGPFAADPIWYHNAQYSEERARGLDFEEDLYRPGSFEVSVGDETWVVATLEKDDWNRAKVDALFKARKRVAPAEPFLVRRHDQSLTVIAGYPWFTDWGRDTMIALPGLLVTTGRLGDARDVIRGFLGHLDRGILPNLFPDRGAVPEYNTVDATLWLFQAVHAYLEAGGDFGLVATDVFPAVREIIRWHLAGTHHGIRVDPSDGLLIAGDAGSNLTWMDARVDGRPVTPRHGKPVEVNALWISALTLAAGWARRLGETDHAARYQALADRAAASFLPTFWNPARGCLYDVIRPEGPDGAVRPNQIFALALPQRLVPEAAARSILRVVEEELLTPVGLRTLAPGEPGYIAHYGGSPTERDGGYHQGTVWPWLVGPYVRAVVSLEGPSGVPRCRRALAGLVENLEATGTLPEVFDAEAPHRPGGAPAQAWSVAELLAALAAVDVVSHWPKKPPTPSPRTERSTA